MRIGDTISMTQEEFIRLAPRGLILQRSGGLYYFYTTQSIDYSYYEASDRVIPGYAYGTFVGHPSGLLAGYWDYFTYGTFRVVALPRTTIYRRSL